MVSSSGGRTEGHVSVRLSPSLKRQLGNAAHANGKTLSAEIIARLERSFEEAAVRATREPSVTDLEKRLAVVEQSVLSWMFTWTSEYEARLAGLEKRLPDK